jgi:UDP-glucose 4-epimerase
MSTRAVVTGGGGFIGSYLVKRLVRDAWDVAVVDTMVRGDARRLVEVADSIEMFNCDVRDQDALEHAFRGTDVVIHLAAINGTENFYKRPELVLDVGIRGALAVVNAARTAGVPDLVVASTAEVYQTPAIVPTPETIPLTLPDSLNPRYSYGGSKIASELIAFNYGQEHFQKVQVFRPHNVYGPDMGFKHVIPQFILRAAECKPTGPDPPIPFQIQGDGSETRAFCFVDDIVDGILTMYERGGHRQIYHIGNGEEVSMSELAEKIGTLLDVQLELQPGPKAEGGTPRRCPDLQKIGALGYRPSVSLDEGLQQTVRWYAQLEGSEVKNGLM